MGYAPRTPVADNRFGNVKSQGRNLWIVLHTSQGSEATNSAEILAGILGVPGTRPNGHGGWYGSSYQMIFDTDQLIPAVPNNVVSYSAGGGNARGIHGVFPGRAGQSRTEWLDTNSRAMIRQAAQWAVDVAASEDIPLVQLSPEQVADYHAGVCDHHAISLAFRKSTHTDLGPNFPWDVFWSDVRALDTPPVQPPSGDDDMPLIAYIAMPPEAREGQPHMVVVNGSVRYAVSEDGADITDHRVIADPKQYDQLLKSAGLA